MKGGAAGERRHDDQADGQRGDGRPESKKCLLVRVAALLEQKRCDEQDEKELRVAEDLRGVSRDEQPHDRAERDLHERQRDARQHLTEHAGGQQAAYEQQDDLER